MFIYPLIMCFHYIKSNFLLKLVQYPHVALFGCMWQHNTYPSFTKQLLNVSFSLCEKFIYIKHFICCQFNSFQSCDYNKIRGATAPKSQDRLKQFLPDGSTGGLVVSKALIPQP